ncbi:MAG: long-chain-fatty-acid--CoA ligase [Rhodospirillaceae bacterium]|nr:long-chain-fatty-acid--CoA ligase [Rhodospirillaceae bacterium]
MLLRGQMMDRPLLLAPLMEFAAMCHGDTPIVTRSVEGPLHRTTYGETYGRIQRLANALVRLGVKPGDRVATLAWNTWRHFELYFAIAGIGAVCHTLNPRLPPDQLKFIINNAEDRLIFFDLTFIGLIAALDNVSPSVTETIVLTDVAHIPDDPRFQSVLVYEDLIAPEPDTFTWPTFDERTAASLCYTSGTTGNPKGVLYSHRALILHSYALATNISVTAEDVSLPVVPMFHVNAWGMPYSAPMSGSALVFAGAAMDGPSLFELMDTEGVTCAQGVPTIWIGLLDQMRALGRKPSALTRVTVGGAAVPESMVDAFERDFGVEVCHGWGMTEMSPAGVINTPKAKFKKLSAAEQKKRKLKQGRLLFGVDMRIVDGAGKVLPNDGDSSGHIQVRGPWIIESYFKETQSALTPDGWFDTGDIGTLDTDGFLQLTDRAKDIIKSGGEWISSVELENAAVGHPGIAQAAVIGVAHPLWQERPLLICVAKGAARPSLADLNAFLLTKVPKWWLPDALEFVDSLPLGATGKVQKTLLRERFRDYHLEA